MDTDNLRVSGTLLFTRGGSVLSGIIRKVEGDECNHVACVRWDANLMQHLVTEMLWHGISTCTLSKWLQREKKCFVYYARPIVQVEKFDGYIASRVNDGVEYGFLGLLAFLSKKLVKANTNKVDICSELCSAGYKQEGWYSGDPRLTSPQDLLRWCRLEEKKFIVEGA